MLVTFTSFTLAPLQDVSLSRLSFPFPLCQFALCRSLMFTVIFHRYRHVPVVDGMRRAYTCELPPRVVLRLPCCLLLLSTIGDARMAPSLFNVNAPNPLTVSPFFYYIFIEPFHLYSFPHLRKQFSSKETKRTIEAFIPYFSSARWFESSLSYLLVYPLLNSSLVCFPLLYQFFVVTDTPSFLPRHHFQLKLSPALSPSNLLLSLLSEFYPIKKHK